LGDADGPTARWRWTGYGDVAAHAHQDSGFELIGNLDRSAISDQRLGR
jgi:hypothetical protein